MKKLIYVFMLTGMIAILSSCGVMPKKAAPIFIDNQDTPSDCKTGHTGQVCFMNYATKIIEIQFDGEEESYSIYPQKTQYITRLKGTHYYTIKIGKKKMDGQSISIVACDIVNAKIKTRR